MALSAAALEIIEDGGFTALAAAVTHVSAHTADPDAGSGDHLAAPKVAETATYNDAGNRVINASNDLACEVNAGATYSVTHHGLWAGATWLGSEALAAPVDVIGGSAYIFAAGDVAVTLEAL